MRLAGLGQDDGVHRRPAIPGKAGHLVSEVRPLKSENGIEFKLFVLTLQFSLQAACFSWQPALAPAGDFNPFRIRKKYAEERSARIMN